MVGTGSSRQREDSWVNVGSVDFGRKVEFPDPWRISAWISKIDLGGEVGLGTVGAVVNNDTATTVKIGA